TTVTHALKWSAWRRRRQAIARRCHYRKRSSEHEPLLEHEGPPLRVVYRLTEAGAALEPALDELGEWAKKYLPDDERPEGC
ncbi:winged helix-turn-helix transcriptional regulator, partial [Streptomyces viridochromogenes]|uniref:winged helix-turn-helix transcriptional regulator n=1 Tax=Streptomyces viridochromogenes TaxID=1938 RepID=UPI001F370C9A